MTFSFRSLLRERPLWILLVSFILFFWRPLTSETFYFRDLYLLFYGKKLLFVEAIRSGQLPLWDPLVHGGQPFLGSPANSVFYPFNLLFLILPSIAAFNVHIVAQVVLCGAGAYFLARAMGLTPVAAFVSGSAYALCGFVLSTTNLLVSMQALPWIPVLLASTHLLLLERRKRWLVIGAIAGALTLFAGSAELTAISFTTALVWAAFVPMGSPLLRRLALAAGVVAFSVVISLAQTLPALEVIQNSRRSEKTTFSGFSQWSVSPQRLPELVVPGFFGPIDAASRHEYWGGDFEFGFPYIASIYFGAPVLLLAIAGALTATNVPPRGRAVLAALALFGLIMSLGRYLPFFQLIHEHVPLIGIFRFPVKALQLSLVPVALLAGCGLDVVRSGRRPLLIAIVMTAMAVPFAVAPALRELLAVSVFQKALAPQSMALLSRGLMHFAGAAAVLVLLVALRRTRDTSSAIAALVLIDLAIAGMSVNLYAPRALYDEPALAARVRDVLKNGGRLYRTDDGLVQRLHLPGTEVYWAVWAEYRRLGRYTAATFGVPVIFHEDYDGLAPLRIRHMTEAIAAIPWSNRLPLLAAGGVSAVISADDVTLPGLDRVHDIPPFDGRSRRLYRNSQSAPVRFSTKTTVLKNDAAAFHELTSKPFDPSRVILSEPGPAASSNCGDRAARIHVLARRINSTSLEVDAPCDGYVVLADTHYPGWRVSVDGRPVEAIRADVAFTAIPVAAGRHRILRRYAPVLPIVGFSATLLGLIALAFVPRRWLADTHYHQ